jgi:hypothetical protein
MSENIKETIIVTYVGQFGPRCGEQWYGLSPKSGLTKDNFEKGKTYQVLVYTSKAGKKYINQIVGEQEVTPPSAPLVADVGTANKEVIVEKGIVNPKTGTYFQGATKFTGRDFDAEARGKVACASWAAALSSPALAMYALNKEDYLTLVETVADKMSKKVFEKQGNL